MVVELRLISVLVYVSAGVHYIVQLALHHLLRFDLRVDVWELLCQFLFLWLMNQLLICFSCRPVSSTSFALSSSVGYGHLECCCHHCLRMLVVSPGSFPALLFLRISSLTSSILDLKPCLSSILSSCLTLSMSERSESVGMSGPKPIMSCPSEPMSRLPSSIGGSSSSSDMVAPVPSSSVAPVRSCRDCSISRHAMTASTACTLTCCCSCSRNEHSSIRYCARKESRSCLSCGERKGRWWAAYEWRRPLDCASCASMRGRWSMGVATRRHPTCAATSCSHSGCTAISPLSSCRSSASAAAAAGGGPKAEPGSATAGDGKEDPKGLFTDNLQTSGAYSAREEGLKREEDSGRLKFLCYSNDGVDEHMIWLVGLKNIFARQLPNMPKEYIVRLVMDRTHKSMMVIRNNIVVGGITYRPYASQRFGEIAFCAITADEQVKGYGTRLMNHLKQHARDADGLTHFLTYADNNAVGYFVKQGFTKEITLDKERWQGYIKDYDGGILMECKIDPKLPYVDLATMIRRQRQAIDEKIRELSNCHIVYSGIDFQKKEAGIPRRLIKPEDIPGLREAGWTPDQWGHSKSRSAFSPDYNTYRQQLTNLMRTLLKSLNEHPDAWPFKEPVDSRDVPDYYDIIKDPIDLKTMLRRVDSEQYYVTLEMFVADMKRMFSNARTYNSPDTIYYKCATRLENFFSTKIASLVAQASTKS